MLLRITIFFFCFMSKSIFSQQKIEFKQQLNTVDTDTARCRVLSFLTDSETDDGLINEYNRQLDSICNRNLNNSNIDQKSKLAFLKFKSIVLNNYGVDYENKGDIPKALECYEKSLKIKEQINDKLGISSSLNNIGLIYSNQGYENKALEYYAKSLSIQEALQDKQSMATTLNNIGLAYYNLKDIPRVLEYYHRSLKLRESIDNKEGIGISLNNIAQVYAEQEDLMKAMEYFEKSLKVGEQINNNKLIATTLNNIGLMYKNKGDFEKALEYYNRSLKIREQMNNKAMIATILGNIGIVYKNKEDYDKALEYYSRSVKLNEEANDMDGLSSSLSNIASLYMKQEKYKEAKRFAERGLKIANEIGYPSAIKSISAKLSKIYAKTGDFENAYEMHVLFKSMSDSINNESNRKATIKSQFKYEFDKRAAADSMRVSEEKKLVAAQLEKEKTQRIALYGGLILVIIFAVFMFNRYRITERQKEIIVVKEQETKRQKYLVEEKQREILDSINYAQRIQYSLLASEKLLNENLKEYFLLFKPKDVVSGDFYWGTKLNYGNFILVTADSTGHGVPGAIMSMLNMSCINEAINSDKLFEPADILNATRQKVISHLANDGSEEGGKDGMDCSLCVFDFKNKILKVAAAHNPVWIVRRQEIIEIKADKMPVGRHDKQYIQFTQHEVKLLDGDMVYTLTDGLPDQFGGEKGKKFMNKNLRELLVANSNLPMKEQCQLLEKTFVDWKGDLEQVDDVTVIGIRIS